MVSVPLTQFAVVSNDFMIRPLLVAFLAGCAPVSRVMSYPSGLNLVLMDRVEIDTVCSKKWDDGSPLGPDDHADACYSKKSDTIYLRNDCLGAEALPHELAHREGVAEPSKMGYDWTISNMNRKKTENK